MFMLMTALSALLGVSMFLGDNEDDDGTEQEIERRDVDESGEFLDSILPAVSEDEAEGDIPTSDADESHPSEGVGEAWPNSEDQPDEEGDIYTIPAVGTAGEDLLEIDGFRVGIDSIHVEPSSSVSELWSSPVVEFIAEEDNGTIVRISGQDVCRILEVTEVMDEADIVLLRTQGHILGSDNDDAISGTEANDTISGFGGTDTIVGAGGDDFIVSGLEGDSSIEGGTGNDTVWGGNGNEEIYGGVGDDYLLGGTGADELFGGEGNDTLTVLGGDTAFGGEGGDHFQVVAESHSYSESDDLGIIADFEPGVDQVFVEISPGESIPEVEIVSLEGNAILNLDGNPVCLFPNMAGLVDRADVTFLALDR